MRLSAVVALLAALFVTTGVAPASAQAAVGDWSALVAALADDEVNVIELADEISEQNQQLTIPDDRDITLDLNDHNLTVGNVFLVTGANLTITDTSAGDGALNAINPTTIYAAAIQTSDASLTIAGGAITATSNWGAGIGGHRGSTGGDDGGDGGDGGEITITGGTINATSNWSAGIGGGTGGNGGTGSGDGGDGGDGGDITITGGTIDATSHWGAGIGGGYGGNAGIEGGDGGDGGYGGEITITGGAIDATSFWGAGIGGGYGGLRLGSEGNNGAGGDGGMVLIDVAAEVVASSANGSAVGPSSGAGGVFGSLEVAGLLTLDSTMAVVSGSAQEPSVEVTDTGVIEGAGSITAASDGAIVNEGAIRNATVTPPSAVVVNNFLVGFVPLGGNPVPDEVRVFAPSFDHGARDLPNPGVDAMWNSEADATGVTVGSSTDISGLADQDDGTLELFAVVPAAIGDPNLGTGQVGVPYSHDLQVTGTPEPVVEIADGELPEGLELVGDVIEGTPGEDGTFQFTITADNGVGSPAEVPAELTIESGDITPGEPFIDGLAAPGKTLTADPGEGWEPQPDAFDYQWLRDGEPAGGATSQEYTVTVDDTGTELSVQVTGTLDGYNPATAESEPVEVPDVEAIITGPDGQPLEDGDTLVIGDDIAADGAGWAPGSRIELELRSDPITLATDTAGDDGTFALAATLDDSIPTGQHTLAVLIDHGELAYEVAVTVTIDPAPQPDPGPEPEPDGPTTGQDPDEAAPGGPPSASTPPVEAGATPATADSAGALPLTGTNATWLAALAAAAIAAGAALLATTRRRTGLS